MKCEIEYAKPVIALTLSEDEALALHNLFCTLNLRPRETPYRSEQETATLRNMYTDLHKTIERSDIL